MTGIWYISQLIIYWTNGIPQKIEYICSLPHQLSRVWNLSRLSVCLCFCVSVNALKAELFDVQTPNLVKALTLIICQMSSKVKVIGHRSKSPG